jgi:hypothetical protein
MDFTGMYMLNTPEYSEEKIKKSLEFLYEDKKMHSRKYLMHLSGKQN